MATEKQPVRGVAQSRGRAGTDEAKIQRDAATRGQARDSKAENDTADDLSAEERRKVEKSQPPRPLVLHEVIRLQGNHELDRTLAALWWSAAVGAGPARLRGRDKAPACPRRSPAPDCSRRRSCGCAAR